MDAETQDAESHNVRAHDVEDHNAAAQSLGSSTAVTSRRPAKVPFWARLLLWLVGIVSFSILLFVTTSVPGGTIISAVILGAHHSAGRILCATTACDAASASA
ncbi:MAG: hypothetical protein V9F03_08100 [Microthrixaceae bacterium]